MVPKRDIVEGQWSIALGRTLDAKRAQSPSISVGIISATGRIWGKALQTDAKISPINYGGPLIDIEGRVQGILVPASPQGEDVTAGFVLTGFFFARDVLGPRGVAWSQTRERFIATLARPTRAAVNG